MEHDLCDHILLKRMEVLVITQLKDLKDKRMNSIITD